MKYDEIGQPQLFSCLEEELKLVLSQITLAVVDEPQNLEKLKKSKAT